MRYSNPIPKNGKKSYSLGKLLMENRLFVGFTWWKKKLFWEKNLPFFFLKFILKSAKDFEDTLVHSFFEEIAKFFIHEHEACI